MPVGFKPIAMKTIRLTHGQVAIVDDADFSALCRWEWSAKQFRDAWYAYRWPEDGSHTRILMHRQLLNVPAKTKVVFLDGNSLNLRRENLSAGCPPLVDGPLPGTKLIPLTRGKSALADAADAEWLARWKWTAKERQSANTTRWYACRNENIGGKSHTVFMHRQILGLGAVEESEVDFVDFWNGDGLDNRRQNLRPCSGSQNNANRQSQAKHSGFKGVYFTPGRDLKRPYRVTIMKNRHSVYLGHFASAEEGARAYDLAAIRMFGAFARLNFPTNGAIANEQSKDDSAVT
jgi:hypothetical protein